MRRYPALTVLAAALLLSPAAGTPAAEQALRQDSALRWSASAPGFGSFSAITVTAEGTGFIALTDKGDAFTGKILRDGAGRIRDMVIEHSGPLLDPRGEPVRRYDTDAEGMTIGADGRIYVSFEGNHRVWAYDDVTGPATPLPVPAAFRALQTNSGLEALFTGPDGAIHAIPERSGALDRPFPVYRFDGQDWAHAFDLPRRPPHLVTGADLGPDGRLYLLERHWNGLLGFSSRIRSFRITPQGPDDERVLMQSPIGAYDNLEGISAWADAEGRTRLTVISDDNNNIFQRNEVIEFILTPASPPRPGPRP